MEIAADMYFSKLSESEKQIVFQCMTAMLNGNFLEHEFQTRLGIDEIELRKIMDDFPNIDDTEDESTATLAINNCLNEVCYGIGFSEKDWKKWFSVEREKIVETYRKWAKSRGWERTGIM